MAELTPQIAQVRLARDRTRLFLVPGLCVVLAVAGGVAAYLLRGPAGISLAALGGLSALVAAYLVALVSSYRLLVEPGGLRLRWLGGEHRYRLMRGQITRVVASGRQAAALRPRFGALGWAVGPAMLGASEQVELIRLAVRTPLIVVPTDRGRLAIAAAVESDLLAALRHAVQLQERLDEVASRRTPAAPTIQAPVAPQPSAPRILTGIERALLEQRQAAERAAAAGRSAAERAAVEPQAAAQGPVAPLAIEAIAVPPAEIAAPAARTRPKARRRQQVRLQRPSWLAVPGPGSLLAALPVALPLVGAGIAWAAVALTGRPTLPAAEARLLQTALLLIGPLGAVGAVMARTWYPRLGGLVAATALTALALLTRTILA